MKRPDRSVPLAAVLVAAGAAWSGAAGAAPGGEAAAHRILKQMSDYLASAGELTFHADETYDEVLANGQGIEYGGAIDVAVRRPDRLHVEYRGDERQSRVVFDGKTFTLHDLAANVYAVTEVPPQLDAAADLVFNKYGFSVPIADLVYSDPYSALTGSVESGFVAGRHAVDGVPCYHLAFSQPAIDWQIWIEDGPRPVPRKLVIVLTDEPGLPRYTARLSGWDFQPRLSDHYFEFRPPDGADEIEFLLAQSKENQP